MHRRLMPWCGVFLFSGAVCAAVSTQARPEISPSFVTAPGLSRRDHAGQELIRQPERERLLRQPQARKPESFRTASHTAGFGLNPGY